MEIFSLSSCLFVPFPSLNAFWALAFGSLLPDTGIWAVGDAVADVAASGKVGSGGIIPACGTVVLGIIGGGGGDTTGP